MRSFPGLTSHDGLTMVNRRVTTNFGGRPTTGVSIVHLAGTMGS